MEKSIETTGKHLEHSQSNIISLAMALGLIVFFITSELPGGLTGVQGFFAGFFLVILLYVTLEVLESRRTRPTEPYRVRDSSPTDVSIKEIKGESGVVIRIYINEQHVLSHGIDNDR